MRLPMRGSVPGALGVAILMTTMLAGSIPEFDPSRVPEPPADPGVGVLQLQEWKSRTAPYERAALPEFTLYGGGRVIARAFWDGALQRASEYTLTPAQYRQLHRLAHSAGLGRSANLRQPRPATDGSLLVVSLRSAGQVYTTEVTSPASTDTGARGRIVEFRRHVRTLAMPADAARAVVYRPTRLAVVATGGWGGLGALRPWPGPDLLAGRRTRMGVCTVLTGHAMSTAEALGRDASLATRWQIDGQALSVTFRPLLPDEHDCADLDRHVP